MYGFHGLCWKCMYFYFGVQGEYEVDIRDSAAEGIEHPSIDSKIRIDNIKLEVNDNASNGSVVSAIKNWRSRENTESVTVSIPMTSAHD